MKPQPFDYADPASLDELLDLLGDAGDDATLIAGGQSLVPLLNLRLARPELVIDPRHISELAAFEVGPSGLRAGAMARVADIEQHSGAIAVPGVVDAIVHIGHSQIRARTTVGGSIAHADPAAELPALLVALEGEVVLRSRDRGERVVSADSFFVGPLMTVRQPDEIITSVWFPTHPGSVGLVELAKRPGDFAIVGAITGFAVADGTITDPRVALFGVAGRPVRAPGAEAALIGQTPSSETFALAGEHVRAELEAVGDVHGSADYRRHVAGTLVERALASVA
jgi:carbon-monoxide dehydrogenase medium subunit